MSEISGDVASIDLKDAYYSVKIHPEHLRFLKFTYKGQLYKFTIFPNGLSSCPRMFTKIMKPLLAKIRLLLHIISGYLDDLYLQNHYYEGCVRVIIDTLQILEQYGFTIHPDKLVLIPSQTITVLGFVINSKDMTHNPDCTKNHYSNILDRKDCPVCADLLLVGRRSERLCRRLVINTTRHIVL